MYSAVPHRVSGVRFVPSPGGNSLSVEWSIPQSGAPILYYEIRYRSDTGNRSWQGPVAATTETVTLRTRLVPTASYGVQVRAVSTSGEGPYSTEETLKRLFQHTAHTYAHNILKHAYTHIMVCVVFPDWSDSYSWCVNFVVETRNWEALLWLHKEANACSNNTPFWHPAFRACFTVCTRRSAASLDDGWYGEQRMCLAPFAVRNCLNSIDVTIVCHNLYSKRP